MELKTVSKKLSMGAVAVAIMFGVSACGTTSPQDCTPKYKEQGFLGIQSAGASEQGVEVALKGGSSGGGGASSAGGGARGGSVGSSSSSSGAKGSSSSSGGSKGSSSSSKPSSATPTPGKSGLGASKGFKPSAVPGKPVPGKPYRVHNATKNNPPIIAVYDDDGGCELRYED